MNFKEYIEFTRETVIYPQDDYLEILSYLVLGLTSEAGEVAGVLKKLIRDNGNEDMHEAYDSKMKKEIGDCFWYLARILDENNYDLEEILEVNIAKLNSRKNRNKLGGSGDDR
jgi:NTP pyrophosphatase (non-canonical NTP hydrolase)